MAVYHRSEKEVGQWDDIQFAYFVGEAQRIGRWLWNFFPPQVGGKKEAEIRENANTIRMATPELLLPSEANLEHVREESEAHGIIGPQ